MLEELAENKVSGQLAIIYDEIRQTTRVPYVSSLQRHLATRPGLLQWAWQVVGQSFREGRAQAIGWTVADELALPVVEGVSEFDAAFDENSQTTEDIANVYRSFIRVSPTNLVVSCILKHRLAGSAASTEAEFDTTTDLPAPMPLPEMLAPLRSLADTSGLSVDAQNALTKLGVVVAGKAFVPGLYRILANWPDYLIHVSQTLEVAKQTGKFDHALELLPTTLDRYSLILQRECPHIVPPVKPGSAEALELIDVIDSYRRTSPEMVIYSKYLLQQLPSLQST